MKAKTLGYKGEDLAAQYLQSKGYEIVAMNFTVRGGEIDIVARQNKLLVFVEVKTRTSDYFGEGAEHVDRLKIRRLQKTIGVYLAQLKSGAARRDPDYRIDIIEIKLNRENQEVKEIRHWQDIEVE